jgi:hypothetical protein
MRATGLWIFALTVALALVLFANVAPGQNNLAELRSRLEHETNPVSKAKIMHDLGEVEFKQIERDVSGGHLPEGLAILKQYDAEVHACVQALDKKGENAEKHPAGFKQLQFSLRESLRRIDALLPGMTADDQAPFLEVRDDLSDLDQHLFRELFPRVPGEK